jgi:cell division septation protein DedD
MMNSRRGGTQLTTMGLNLLAILSSAVVATNALEIPLRANESIATLLGYDDILYFQPESPPSSDMICSEQCPCPDDDGSNGGKCFCDLEMVCGGSIPLDLSSSSSSANGGDNDNILKFIWNAPQDSTIIIQGDYTTEASNAGGEGNTQWITSGGDFGTEFELRLQPSSSEAGGNSCEMMYQDVPTEDITLRFDNNNNDDHTQKYHKELSMKRSFIELDSECGIFMRIRFEPKANGKLDLQFSRLTIEAKYDLSTVAKGERMYDWSTSSYMWVRQPYDGLIRVESSIVGSSSSTTSTSTVSTTTTESAIDEPSEPTAATATSSTTAPGTTTNTCYHKEEGIKWGCSNPDRIECTMNAKPLTSQITGYPASTTVLECTSWKDVGCCQDGVGGYYAIDYCAGFGSGSCCAEGEADTNVGCVALTAPATTTATSNSQSTGATVSPPSSSSTTVFELKTSTTTVPPLTTTMSSSEEETTTTKPTPLPTAPPIMSSSLCNNSVTYALRLLVSSIFTLVWHF